MSTTDDWDDAGYVVSSSYRTDTLTLLEESGPATPSTIAKATDIEITHVSRALQELRDRGLVELMVPDERRKGRLYAVTEMGETVFEQVAETAGGGA